MTAAHPPEVGGHRAPGAAACPDCGQPVGTADEFCEACGATLGGRPPMAAGPAVDLDADRTHLTIPAPVPGGPPAPAVCAQPGCPGTIEDGYCDVCGARAPGPRDHLCEQPAPWVGAVSDRGRRHWRNEDAMATAADATPGSWCALVVCDGVTTSTDSDRAAVAASLAALDVLTGARATGGRGRSADFWVPRVVAAAAAGDSAAVDAAAVVRTAAGSGVTDPVVRAGAGAAGPDNPPASTFVAVVCDGSTVVCGNVGDSRAYWLPDGAAPVILSADDSWAAEQVRAGTMAREEAEADPRAHAITRWLGADSPDATAAVSVTATGGMPGWLIVCTDGLWNYCSTAVDLAALVARLAAAAPAPPALAGALVEWANDQGGHDNVTVAAARIAAQPAAPAPPR